MKDQYGRTIDYMRISITDRCNLRCKYCMPQDIEKVPMQEILTYEEIECIVKASVALGITNYRITGGEPLVRKNCADLIAKIKKIEGVDTVSITTNGMALTEQIADLQRAGLDSINVSLDTLDEKEFEDITGRPGLSLVLQGIESAIQYGIPVKLNTVTRQNLNWEAILSYADAKQIPVRFIEMMPIGHGKEFVGVSNDMLISQIQLTYGKPEEIGEAGERLGKGPAAYLKFPEYAQPIGFISAMNHKFCASCNRVRLSSQGWLKVCLCYEQGTDLKSILRDTQTDDRQQRLESAISDAIYHKAQEHCFGQEEQMTEQKDMVQIGG